MRKNKIEDNKTLILNHKKNRLTMLRESAISTI